MTNGKPQSYIHYDPVRVDYAVSKGELENLKNAVQNHWKDFGIACLAVGLSCAINSVPTFLKEPFQVTISLFLNSLFGIVGIVLGIIFLFVWFKKKTDLDGILNTIKNKPKIEITPTVTNVGQIEPPSTSAGQ